MVKIIFTYRTGFPEILGTGWKTDYGWGCTIRAGQMMLSNYLLKINSAPILYIPTLFFDTPKSEFSIHRLCEAGLQMNKKPGHWYSPDSIGKILEKLTNYIICDSYPTDIQLEEKKYNFLWLIPLRLGLCSIAREYVATIIKLMQLPQNVGACGGKGDSAYFFFRVINDEWLYLDPHDTRLVSNEPMDYLTTDYKSCNMKHVNSSILVGFSIKSEEDYRQVRSVLQEFDFITETKTINDTSTVISRMENDFLIVE